jgi:hypothetical protein
MPSIKRGHHSTSFGLLYLLSLRLVSLRLTSLRLTSLCLLFALNLGCTPKETPNLKESADRKAALVSSPKESNGANPSDGEKPNAIEYTTHSLDVGIDFTYRNGEAAWLAAMIESNGGGIGWIDYDRDGRWDMFIPGGGLLTAEKQPVMVSNGMFRQNTSKTFQASAVTSCTANGVCYSFGAAVADYDADGFPDIFITGYGGQQLLHNLGDGTFEDATAKAGFTHRGWSSSAAWLDLENDGDLDLYIAHYGVWSPETDKRCFNGEGQIDRCAPADYVGESDELWINQGNGVFLDQSEYLQQFSYRGIGAVACDFDLDGDTDIYVANDEDPNTLFDNLGKGNLGTGNLKEIGAQSGTSLGSRSIVDGSMGLAVGDFDGNHRPDILVTNYQNEYCELYLNQGKQYFTLGTRSAGLMALGQAVVGWGTSFADVDLDGDEDLLVIAGHTSRKPIKSSNLQKPYLLENRDRKRLVSIGESTGEFFRQVHAGRGMATADYDNDGDIDFAVSKLEQPVELLRNDQSSNAPRGNYLLIDLVGGTANRDAIGAWVELETNTQKQVRHRTSGGSYASTHASSLHFGLGHNDSKATNDSRVVDKSQKGNAAQSNSAEPIKRITIHWPGGKTESLTDVLPNQRLLVIESSP